MATVDAVTQSWIRNRSDELAVEAGCVFDEDRGREVCDWIESNLNLYEGELAGQPMTVAGWHREATMRLFGWVKYSERYKRWIRRFKRASVWVPKKRGKSPWLAGIGLYLMCADGEQGQKVYFAAKDGGQAREIAAKHALEMVLSSPFLSDPSVIDVNRSLMQLTHKPSRSILKPISSGDQAAAKAKEGLNGCILVDECHVVDRAFISRVSRAGISRSEPIFLEVSTAGKDPESYGKSQYDYGKRVEAGDVVDHEFFFLCYEAPQQLTDEDLAADPLKWGRMANPEMGGGFDEDEFLADYNRSKNSLPDLADFKTYRLNIWQQAASPWLRIDDWNACRADFTEEDMIGRECYTALDLAKTQDMTSLALVFPWENGRYRILVYFFMPENGLKRVADKTHGMLDWAARKWIAVTPGDVTDYRFVKKVFAEKYEKFTISKLVYDPWNAEQLTQELADELGIDREKFSQSVSAFNEPTQDFERFVISREIEHNGNPVLSWQMGHATVKTDANANKKPIKPTPDDPKKIDGVIAGIMAFAAARAGDENANWFRDSGI